MNMETYTETTKKSSFRDKKRIQLQHEEARTYEFYGVFEIKYTSPPKNGSLFVFQY